MKLQEHPVRKYVLEMLTPKYTVIAREPEDKQRIVYQTDFSKYTRNTHYEEEHILDR